MDAIAQDRATARLVSSLCLTLCAAQEVWAGAGPCRAETQTTPQIHRREATDARRVNRYRATLPLSPYPGLPP